VRGEPPWQLGRVCDQYGVRYAKPAQCLLKARISGRCCRDNARLHLCGHDNRGQARLGTSAGAYDYARAVQHDWAAISDNLNLHG